ncbi:MAG TPA: asparagine synthase (glutamine-hydrolyzing) [Phycisphaerae bacterium]|jgi:asparagine synthase (glutamine-hydrolysing)|nr:asparagine synthase (glutamine-hydrolyzing) [Phycisphaerae bacterium]HOB74298.1 asparagine synthase (glutamine-hydrolyzing) [Phycisphaerae bacterium]HOJ53111.1 asparagine synthase (glutamine-hydrolyzing) [Phycisphaerae bacterium]HOL24848.1 asparagine synthase (glutamine-hydrolyzing) [Phycisphaerae bacterium]HPP19384.1 asparagine synthase (glutamine-hydrolyzing) [Phycisphaerae bacterium]
MCGIAGLVRFAGLLPHERDLGAAMAATLRHRGPDEMGAFHDACASLGHARLSIIDLEAGRQPMSNEDATIWVTFNGEIYNHRELAAGLRARGHQLRTRCDTEVIVHLYEEHGEDFVHHLNGMFALALWDARQRKLVLVRDRLGIKPLYWHDDGRRVVFGSELKALLAAGVERRVDLSTLTDYLTFGHVPAPRSIFRDVYKLEPGCLVVCTEAGSRVRTWWDIPPAGADHDAGASKHERGASRGGGYPARVEDYAESDFANLIEDAAEMRLIADVPVGAFLSGGVDSATVAAAMRRRSSGAVLTQTVGFDEADHDEREAARATARLLGTDHHEILVRADACAAAERLAWHFDEPFADASAVPTFYLSQATRQRVTVALAGDGADEMLGGYRRYRFDLAEERVRRMTPACLRVMAGAVGKVYPKADWLPRPLRAKVTLQNLAVDPATAHLRSVSLRAGALPGLLLRPEVSDTIYGYDPFERGRAMFERYESPHTLGRLLYLDMKTLLPDDMLTKVDRASMAVGLEVREPLLDYRVVERAARLSPALRQGKRALREVLANWTTPDLARRRKKGFDVPLDAWFRGPLRRMAHDLLTGPQARVNTWLCPRAVRRLLREHDSGLRSNGSVLWTVMMLELWARQWQST